MDALAPVAVIVRLGLDQGVEGVHDAAVAHDDNAHRAHAGALAVGGREIYGGKILHWSSNSSAKVI